MLGLCISPRYREVEADLATLKPAFVRSILYDVVDDLDWLLSLNLPILLTLNNEADMVAGWSGWENALRYVAARSHGRIMGVSCGNELSGFWAKNPADVPPEFGADLIRKAAPILRQAGIKVYTDALAGPRWYDYLQRLLQLAGDDLDGIDSHAGYGRSPDNWGSIGWGFGSLRDMVGQIRRLTALPIVMSELGVKVVDAGTEQAQATYLTAADATLGSLGVTAAWFAWSDLLGAPDERGVNGFGLKREDGSRRPAWDAFTALASHHEPPPPPPPPPDPEPDPIPEPVLSAREAAFRDLWQAAVPGLTYNPEAAFQKWWRQHPEAGSPVGPEHADDEGVYQAFSVAGVMQWMGGDEIGQAAVS